MIKEKGESSSPVTSVKIDVAPKSREELTYTSILAMKMAKILVYVRNIA